MVEEVHKALVIQEALVGPEEVVVLKLVDQVMHPLQTHHKEIMVELLLQDVMLEVEVVERLQQVEMVQVLHLVLLLQVEMVVVK